MKLFFVLLFTVACNFYFEAATKETLEIFDILTSTMGHPNQEFGKRGLINC